MWVLGYGSLMRDGCDAALGGMREDHAVLLGYRRSLNKKSVVNCGTPDFPAPTLGF
jgi:cation transport regulator ChaC